jgi:hypothetical protein
MKWTLLIITSILLLCAGAALPDGYSTSAPGGAPTPINPTSPESLGLQAPSIITTSDQAPSTSELSQGLMKADQESAYAAAPQGLKYTSSIPVSNQMIYSPIGSSPNSLYISYAPLTIASCNLYSNLPLWITTSNQGRIWFYEWYPNGMLDTKYAGYSYSPGWYKRWFFADVPGWHILQYYCNGWSNYAYIYVYSPYWTYPNPAPYTYSYGPYDYPHEPYDYLNNQGIITYTYPATGHTYYS